MSNARLAEIFPDQVSGYWGVESGKSQRDVRIIRNGDLAVGGRIRWDSLPLRGLTEKQFQKSQVLSGDLLLTTSGNCGRVALARSVPFVACNSNFVRRLRVNEKLADSGYMFHLMNSERLVSEFARFTRGTTLQNLSVGAAFASISVALPSVEEQRRIAAILDAVDALRTKRRQAIAKLDTLTQAIFVDMFGDPSNNPRDWTECRLEEIAVQVTDGEHATPPRSESGVKLLSARNVRNGYLDLGDVDYVEQETYERLRRRCDPQAGDLLISCSGTIGRVVRLDGAEPFSLVRSVALVRPDHEAVESRYLDVYLRTPAMNRLMKQRANASSQANLFQNQVRSLPVLVPPLDHQREFSRLAATVKGVGRGLSGAESAVDTLFASVQQQAFRGDL